MRRGPRKHRTFYTQWESLSINLLKTDLKIRLLQQQEEISSINLPEDTKDCFYYHFNHIVSELRLDL
jgi:hypothetical protein